MEQASPEVYVVGRPASVMIELTNHCQLACFTCPRDKQDAHDYDIGFMPLEVFQKVFLQFEDTIETLDLTGLGESLMHPQVFDIIRFVRSRKKVHIYLTTNTILLNDEKLTGLEQDPVDTLCVSIDGTNQEQFSSVRGQLHYGRLKRRVQRAVTRLGNRTEFILCVVLVRQNLDATRAFVDLAAELGIRRVSLKPINLVSHPLPVSYYDLFRTPHFKALTDEARRRGDELGIDVSVFRIGSYTCTFPWEPIYVTWDGYLVPCCAKPFPKRLNFGNLLQRSYEEVKNGPAAVSFRARMLSGDPPDFCNKCHVMATTIDRG